MAAGTIESAETNDKIMRTLKVAVSGVGFIGPAHIEALRRLPNIEVAAIFNRGKEKVKSKAQQLGVEQYFDDYRSMLNQVSPDCVHICTPNNLHFQEAKIALEQGIHVVCEKPLATTIEQAEELVELASRTKLVNAIHFNIRYYPVVRQMRRMRETGALGEVYSIIGSYLQDWLFYQTDYNWRLEPEQSGESRALADIGSHLLDLLEYVSGCHISAVMADMNTVHKTRKKPLKPVETYSGKILQPDDYQDVKINTEDYASVLLRFDNGNSGVITVSQVAAGRKNRLSLEIAGSGRTFSWNSEAPNELWLGERDQPNGVMLRDPSLFDPEAAKLVSYPGGHNEGFPDTSKQLFKEVYAAIRAGRQPDQPKFPTFKDGLRELVLNEAILESAKEERWVKI
ncbi:MAG: dehydrogenase [Cyclobacteriaceae bacterium]|nr:MAG: dehydrogenase [Cyclobacteriaceae bacterium]